MNAVSYDLGKRMSSRNLLKEVLPLRWPYSCNVSVANVCDFKCYYCVNADKEKKKNFGISNTMLSYEDFVSMADHLKGTEKLKSMIFAGVGEPLLNKALTRMFRYVKDKKIAEKIEVITNGASLTKELCEELVLSGLDRVRISLNGLSEEDYRENCDFDLDYEKFKDNLRYLYEYRTKQNADMSIYIKIMDVMVRDQNRKEQFYSEYGNICDDIYIESLMPINNMEYDDEPEKFSKTLFGENVAEQTYKVCPQPFYSFSIGTKGEVYPCCQIPMPKPLGNLRENSLEEIWNGQEYLSFLLALLDGTFKKIPVCDKCKKYEYMTLKTDVLDGSEELLIDKYRRML